MTKLYVTALHLRVYAAIAHHMSRNTSILPFLCYLDIEPHADVYNSANQREQMDFRKCAKLLARARPAIHLHAPITSSPYM